MKTFDFTEFLTRGQEEALVAWKAEQDEKVRSVHLHSEDLYGPVGGGYSYTFTPTSIGLAISVQNIVTREEIDLTNYEQWLPVIGEAT